MSLSQIRNMEGQPVYPTITFNFHFNGTYFPYVYLDAKNFDSRADQRFTASSNTHGVVSILLRRRTRVDTPQNPCIADQVREMRRQIVLNVTGSKFTFFLFPEGLQQPKVRGGVSGQDGRVFKSMDEHRRKIQNMVNFNTGFSACSLKKPLRLLSLPARPATSSTS